MGLMIVGWALIVVGFLFLLLGFASAARRVLRYRSNRNTVENSSFDESLIKLSIELITALSKAPMWLALSVVGLVFIIIGSRWAF